MRFIGNTSDGNVIVEITPVEYQSIRYSFERGKNERQRKNAGDLEFYSVENDMDFFLWSATFEKSLRLLCLNAHAHNRLQMACGVLSDRDAPQFANVFTQNGQRLDFDAWVCRVVAGELDEHLMTLHNFGEKSLANLKTKAKVYLGDKYVVLD